MRGRHTNLWWARAGMAAGLGALLFTVGCGASQNGVASAAPPAAAAQPGTPVVVSCEPNQRTLVRPTVINGVALSQVECVTAGDVAVAANQVAPSAAAVPVSYLAAAPRTAPRSAEWGDTRIVQPEAASYPVAARPVRTQQIVYDDERPVRVVKRSRSVKKSAIIIGSSAGVGAGVGAAVGGKKGALIGAVVGGGGATLWDQITRRKD